MPSGDQAGISGREVAIIESIIESVACNISLIESCCDILQCGHPTRETRRIRSGITWEVCGILRIKQIDSKGADQDEGYFEMWLYAEREGVLYLYVHDRGCTVLGMPLYHNRSLPRERVVRVVPA